MSFDYKMTFRTLLPSDYETYIKVINEFRKTEFTESQFLEVLAYIKKTGDVWVLVVENEIVATGTIFYEKKFIYNLCTLAHIEDVCVISSKRGEGYGKKLIQHLLTQAKEHNCYKVTLDCNDSNVGFYESCGLTKRGNQMCEFNNV